MMPFNPNTQVRPLDMITVNYQGKRVPAQFIGVYSDSDGRECCVGLLDEFIGPDGQKHTKPRNVRIMISEILEVNNGTRTRPNNS